MSSPSRSGSALYLVVLLAACEGSDPIFSEADGNAVRTQVDRYVETALAGDCEAFANVFTADAVQFPPNSPPVEGRQAIVDLCQSYQDITRFTATVDEVAGVGDLAYSRGTFSVAFTAPGSSEATDNGSYINIHRRAADGSWPYVRSIWHSDIPIQAPPPPTPQ